MKEISILIPKLNKILQKTFIQISPKNRQFFHFVSVFFTFLSKKRLKLPYF